jgi:hypothetical protein
MATVRISGSTPRNIHKLEWLGAPVIDQLNRIERSIDLPEPVYRHIEEGIAKGFIEGILVAEDGRRFEWFLDRGSRASGPASGPATVGCGEGI